MRAALAAIERAHGVVITTPVYKASYTGVLKSLLDLLPHIVRAHAVVIGKHHVIGLLGSEGRRLNWRDRQQRQPHQGHEPAPTPKLGQCSSTN